MISVVYVVVMIHRVLIDPVVLVGMEWWVNEEHVIVTLPMIVFRIVQEHGVVL